jgi:methyl-accepting chemotaxis protein
MAVGPLEIEFFNISGTLFFRLFLVENPGCFSKDPFIPKQNKMLSRIARLNYRRTLTTRFISSKPDNTNQIEDSVHTAANATGSASSNTSQTASKVEETGKQIYKDTGKYMDLDKVAEKTKKVAKDVYNSSGEYKDAALNKAHEASEAIKETGKRIYNQDGTFMEMGNTVEKVKDASQKVSQYASKAKVNVSEIALDVADKARDKGIEAADKARETANMVKEKGNEALKGSESIKDKAVDMGHQAAKDAGGKIYNTSGELKDIAVDAVTVAKEADEKLANTMGLGWGHKK